MNSSAVECLVLKDESWRETFYTPVSEIAHHLVGGYLIFLTCFGMVGNGLSLFLFLSTKALQTPENVLLFNQSVIDTLMMFFGQPYFAVASFYSNFHFDCNWIGPLLTFGGIGSIVNLAMIGYDRFVMICFPAESFWIRSMSRSLRLVAFVWTYAIVIAALPSVAGVGSFMPHALQTSCTFDLFTQTAQNRTYILTLYFAGFIYPFCFLVFCYVSIVQYISVRNKMHAHKVALRSAATVAASASRLEDPNSRPSLISAGETNGREKASAAEKKERQILRVSMMCVAAFLVTWGPWAVVGVVAHFVAPALVSPYLTLVPAVACKSNCVINPVIYAVKHPDYRRGLKRHFTFSTTSHA